MQLLVCLSSLALCKITLFIHGGSRELHIKAASREGVESPGCVNGKKLGELIGGCNSVVK